MGVYFPVNSAWDEYRGGHAIHRIKVNPCFIQPDGGDQCLYRIGLPVRNSHAVLHAGRHLCLAFKNGLKRRVTILDLPGRHKPVDHLLDNPLLGVGLEVNPDGFR
jgi:hypothetical protein